MAVVNVSPRKRRSAILSAMLTDLDGALALVIDCLTPGCAGERRVLLRGLAGVYGRDQTVAEALRRMRCIGRGRTAGAAWLVAGPGMVRRARTARLALIGPEAAREWATPFQRNLRRKTHP